MFRGGGARGSGILQEFPDSVLVAQCDGEEAALLAHGVVDALASVLGARYAQLSCSHSGMLKAFRECGFRVAEYRPLVFFGEAMNSPQDTGDWLVNFDWGGNGLRGPFPDWTAGALPGRESRVRTI